MKSVVIHRIAVAMSLLLLIAVVETDDVVSFVGEVTDGSLADAPLPMSDIVKCLKEYVDEFLESSPHGLSVQLSRVLLSYHKPENSTSQILYCSAEADDAALLQEYFTRYFQNPASERKVISYKGEDIAVYPMADGHELSAYVSDNQLAISFSSELLQQVIEAQQQSGTLSSNAAFMDLQNTKSAFVRTAVFQQKDNHWEILY